MSFDCRERQRDGEVDVEAHSEKLQIRQLDIKSVWHCSGEFKYYCTRGHGFDLSCDLNSLIIKIWMITQTRLGRPR